MAKFECGKCGSKMEYDERITAPHYLHKCPKNDPTLISRAEADTNADERNRMAREVLKLADYIEEVSSTLHGWIAADLRKLVKSPIVGDRMVARAEVAERLEGFANAEELNEFEGTALNQVMGRERAAALRHAADYFHRATREAEAVDPDGGGGK